MNTMLCEQVKKELKSANSYFETVVARHPETFPSKNNPYMGRKHYCLGPQRFINVVVADTGSKSLTVDKYDPATGKMIGMDIFENWPTDKELDNYEIPESGEIEILPKVTRVIFGISEATHEKANLEELLFAVRSMKTAINLEAA